MKKIFSRKINIVLTFLFLCVTSAFVLTKPSADEATTNSTCSSLTGLNATPSGSGCAIPEIFSSDQTIKGEVTSTLDKTGEPGNYCAKFKLGISGHHDVVILEKSEVTIDSDADLLKCQEVAQSLEKAYTDGTVKVASVTGIVQPFRENYYYVRNYPEQITVPGKNFNFFHDLNADNNYKYDKNYYDYFYNNYPNNTGGVSAIQNFCRVHLEQGTNKLLAFEVRYRPTDTSAGYVSGRYQNISKCATIPVTWTCNHKNVYTYGLKYQINQNGSFQPITATEPHKCEEMKLNFTPSSEWFQTLSESADNATALNNVVPLSSDMFISPPTDILSCSDQANCLASANKQTTEGNSWGKGAQKVPAGFVDTTQNSINAGNDSGVTCTNGKCTSFTSGNHLLNATIPASSYFGECGNNTATVDLPEVQIPQITSSSQINIVDRPPTVQVGLGGTTLNKNEEVDVTCDAADPDTCSDKITKIKWTCFDSNGLTTNCYFGKDGIWKSGESIEEIPESSATNPYRATAKFKVSADGNYAVSCEAWDNDKIAQDSGGSSGSSSSVGLTGINVGGVIAAEMNFCAVIPDSEQSGKVACGETGKAKFKAYTFNIDPQTYKWQCAKNSAMDISTSDKKECTYSSQGTFSPSLTIIDKDGKEHVCTSASTSVKITNTAKCQVLSRVIGSNDDYTSSLQIQEGTDVESIVKAECLKTDDVAWSANNGNISSTDQNKSVAKFSVAGQGSVDAGVKKDGNTVKCDSSSITIKAKTSFGTN